MGAESDLDSTAKTMVKAVWQQNYSDVVVADDYDGEEAPPPKRRKFFDPFDHNDSRKQPQQQNRRISGDEYESESFVKATILHIAPVAELCKTGAGGTCPI